LVFRQDAVKPLKNETYSPRKGDFIFR